MLNSGAAILEVVSKGINERGAATPNAQHPPHRGGAVAGTDSETKSASRSADPVTALHFVTLYSRLQTRL